MTQLIKQNQSPNEQCPTVLIYSNNWSPCLPVHKLVNMWFTYTQISTTKCEIVLLKVLHKFLQYVLPLHCNQCTNMTSMWQLQHISLS